MVEVPDGVPVAVVFGEAAVVISKVMRPVLALAVREGRSLPVAVTASMESVYRAAEVFTAANRSAGGSVGTGAVDGSGSDGSRSPGELVSVADAASRVGWSTGYVRRLVRCGVLSTHGPANGRLVDVDELDELVRRRRAPRVGVADGDVVDGSGA